MPLKTLRMRYKLNAKRKRLNPLRADPSRTLDVRKAYQKELERRFKRIKGEVWKAIVVEDALGLLPTNPLKADGRTVTNVSWRFSPDPEKIRQFNAWIRRVAEDVILREDDAWEAFIRQGYERGAGRAFDDTNRARRWSPGEGDFYRGSRQEFLRSSFAQPVSVTRLQTLVGRNLNELEGLTEEMVRQTTRTLADGLVRGISPREIGAELAQRVDVGLSRATTIARTEIIRAHADGQLISLELMGVEEVGVMVEWSTSKLGETALGNPSPCPLCEPMEGTVLRIEEAKGMIPRHPNCMCAFVPANVGEGKEDQQRGKSTVEGAIERSLRRSSDDDEWGPATDISRDRPRSVLNSTSAALIALSRFLLGAK